MNIKKIGNIELTTSLWWINFDNVETIQTETANTIDGGVIVWEQTRQNSAINIDLDSLTDAWQTKEVKDLIKALVALGETTTITTVNDEEIIVRFRNEERFGAVEFEPILEVQDVDYYNCKIKLARL